MLNDRINKLFICFLCVVSISFPAAGVSGGEKAGIGLDGPFYRNLLRTPAIQRDDYIEKNLNRVVSASGKIISVDKSDLYNRGSCIVLSDRAAARYNITILYHVYLRDMDSAGALAPDDMFSFTGQIAAYTPLNSARSGYIIDVLFQTGSVTLE